MARRRPPTVHGFLIIDKPADMTSHDVVAKVRRRFGERRVGHAGTLDPDATGVLLVGVGHATRLLTFLTGHDKRYVAEAVLGVETTTLDAGGEIVATHDMGDVTLDDARRVVAEHLTGAIEQVPPMVSAIRVDGRRLHELARQGIEVERSPRPVTVYRFDVDATGEPGVLRVDITCSSGTYVRSLVADLGRLLGGGAHVRNLRRVSSGSFDVSEAAPLDTAVLRAPIEALRDFELVRVDEQYAAMVSHGRVLDEVSFVAQTGARGRGPWAVLGPQDELLAVYGSMADGPGDPERAGERRVKPLLVIPGDE